MMCSARRKVLDAAAADHDHGVFLKVVTFTRDVADHFKAVCETHLGDLAKGRVRFFGVVVYTRVHTPRF